MLENIHKQNGDKKMENLVDLNRKYWDTGWQSSVGHVVWWLGRGSEHPPWEKFPRRPLWLCDSEKPVVSDVRTSGWSVWCFQKPFCLGEII